MQRLQRFEYFVLSIIINISVSSAEDRSKSLAKKTLQSNVDQILLHAKSFGFIASINIKFWKRYFGHLSLLLCAGEDTAYLFISIAIHPACSSACNAGKAEAAEIHRNMFCTISFANLGCFETVSV